MPRRKPNRLKFSDDVELTREQKLILLADALSDPMDVRTEEELERQLDLNEGEVARLKNDPGFYDPICARYMEKVSGNVAVEVIRELMRTVKRGGMGKINAAKLLLQVSGRLGIPGVTVNVNASGTQLAIEAQSLSPVELDREINRLLLAVNPHDVAFSEEGKVVQAPYELIEEISSLTSDPAVEAARSRVEDTDSSSSPGGVSENTD